MQRFTILVLLALSMALTACGDDSAAGNNTNENENETTAVCGNGDVEDGEACDDGTQNSDSEPDACRSDCREAYCGDSVADTSEVCDGADLGGQSCGDHGYVDAAGLACDDDCEPDASGCLAMCGNGVAEPGEPCDATDLGGATCLDVAGGFTGGALACASLCDYDTTGCTTCGDGVCEPLEGASSCPEDCGVVKLATARMSTCAVRADTTVVCWGRNDYGQLGNGTHGIGTESSVPVAVVGLSGVSDIDAGETHYCVLLDTGFVHCWGRNQYGQLGIGTVLDSDVPAEVSGISGQIGVAAGAQHSCAVRQPPSEARCWGRGNAGQLGNGDTADSTTPVMVSGITNWTSLTCGGGWLEVGHCCGLRDNNVTLCWGSNFYGQLGNGTDGSSEDLVQTLDTPWLDWIQLSAGGAHTCGLRIYGQVACWGANSEGQLGLGDQNHRNTPTLVSAITNAVLIGAGDRHTCALLNDGTVECFGRNFDGQLGDGNSGIGAASDVPVQVVGLSAATHVAAGYTHTCAVLDDGTVRCWGINSYGQLGDGTTVDSALPVTTIDL